MSISAATLAAAKSHADQAIHKAELDDIQLDKTLAKSNYAADAKTVGDALNNRVRFDQYQALDGYQKDRARYNIGAAALGEWDEGSYSHAAIVGQVKDQLKNVLGNAEFGSLCGDILNSSQYTKDFRDCEFISLWPLLPGVFEYGAIVLSKEIPQSILQGSPLIFQMEAKHSNIMDENIEPYRSIYYLSNYYEDADYVFFRDIFSDEEDDSIVAVFKPSDPFNLGVNLEPGLYSVFIQFGPADLMYEVMSIKICPFAGGWEDNSTKVDPYLHQCKEEIPCGRILYGKSITPSARVPFIVVDTMIAAGFINKVSDQIFTLEELNGNFGVLDNEGYYDNEWSALNEEGTLLMSADCFVVLKDDLNYDLMTFPTKGIYFSDYMIANETLAVAMRTKALIAPEGYVLTATQKKQEIKNELLPEHLQFGVESYGLGSTVGKGNTFIWDGNSQGMKTFLINPEEAGVEDEDVFGFVATQVSKNIPSTAILEDSEITVYYRDSEGVEGVENYNPSFIEIEEGVYTNGDLIIATKPTKVWFEDIEQTVEPGLYFVTWYYTDGAIYYPIKIEANIDFSPKPGKIDFKYMPVIELTTPLGLYSTVPTQLSPEDCALLEYAAEQKISPMISFTCQHYGAGGELEEESSLSANFMFGLYTMNGFSSLRAFVLDTSTETIRIFNDTGTQWFFQKFTKT